MPAAAADPLTGTVVAGRYQVVRLLGRGGMGSVYEVRHLKVPRTFAMKRLDAARAADPEALARFRREAEVVARLRHPNVVEIVDWETLEDGSPCMIIELLQGEDLAARIRGRGPLPWGFIGRIADQVLSALEVAHRAGIVHRDLKPANVFLARDDAGGERAKLLDFGVSKIRDSAGITTTDDALIGTPAYMSPEQADGRAAEVGPATDAWAMGAILFEMATGRLPFPATGVPSMLHRICYGEAERLPPLRPDAPSAFVELVERALSRDPARRLGDVSALRAELERALAAVAPDAFVDSLPAPAAAQAAPAARAVGVVSTLSAATGEPSITLRPRRRTRLLVVAASALTVLAAAGGAWVAFGGLAVDAPAPEPPRVTAVEDDAGAEALAAIDAGPRLVTVRLESEPLAEVYAQGKRLGGTPLEIVVTAGSSQEVELRADGYVPRRFVLDGGSQLVTVVLERRERSGSRAPRPPATTTDPPPPPVTEPPPATDPPPPVIFDPYDKKKKGKPR